MQYKKTRRCKVFKKSCKKIKKLFLSNFIINIHRILYVIKIIKYNLDRQKFLLKILNFQKIEFHKTMDFLIISSLLSYLLFHIINMLI